MRLRELTLRFNQHVLDPKHLMIQHLDMMKDMILELRNVGCELSDEEKVQAVLSHLKLEATIENLNVLSRLPLSHMPVSVSPTKARTGINRLVQDRVRSKAKARTWPHE
ncbi:hypothetical protein Salat_2772000, partial [Sesamum alatum]